jgi:hypothetical protein
MEFNINNLINNFYNFYEKTNFIDKSNINNEVELTYINPDLILLSNLYSYSESIKKTYLEYNLRFVNNKSKLRQRHPYEYSTFEITNNYLVDRLDNNWERKTIVNDEKLIINEVNNESILFRHSTEYLDNDIELPILNNIMNKISVNFVTSVYIIIDNMIKVEFKIKANIGSISSNKLILTTYFNDIIFARKHTSYYIEIEILKNKKFEKDILIQKLNKSFMYLFSVKNLNNFSLISNKEKPTLKTHMITYNKLNTISKESYILTIKIDGEVVEFTIKDNLCSIIIQNFIYKNLKCNIKPGTYIRGLGEYICINKVKTVYPFYFYQIDGSGNRYDQIQYYNSLVFAFKPPMDINFEKKIIENFTSESVSSNVLKFYKNISENSMTANINDGVILLDISKNDIKKDYKFKIDNTVDIVCKLETYRGVFTMHKDGLYITFSLYQYDYKNFTEIQKYSIKNDSISYDNNTNLIHFKNNTKYGPRDIISPIYCIVEYSFLESKIKSLRIDKTNNFFRNNYNGNGLEVIINSKQIHEQYPNYSIDYLLSIDNTINIITEDQNRSKLLLNKEIKQYFLENTVRTPLNNLVNYMKTNAISMTASKLVNRLSNRYILSIDIGRGGDLNKYYYVGITGMLGTDPDKKALQEARDRYKKLQLNSNAQSSVYKFSTINMSILNDNYLSNIKKTFLNVHNIQYFGLIEWQMAIHYSYNDETKYDILSKLKSLSGNGTKLIITCFDGDAVLNKLNINSNLIYNIQPGITFKISKLTEDKISVLYNASMTDWLDEYLIRHSIIDDFSKYNFKLNDTFKFSDIYNIDSEYTLNVLSTFPRKSTNIFYNKILNDKINDDIKELMSLFKVYVFKYYSHN